MKTNSLSEAAAKVAATPPQNNAVAKTEKKVLPPTVVVGNMLAKYKVSIAQALPSVMTPERFTRIATNVIAGNPKLMQVVAESPRTLVGALMTCAQLGIEPNTPLGQGFILPYYNKNKVTGEYEMQASFQLGYQGLIDLCYRSGEVTLIQAHAVHARDEYQYELGLDPVLKHRPYRGADRGDAIAYYGIFKTKTGATGFAWMWKEEVLDHAKRFSKSYSVKDGDFYGPWKTDFDSMAKKTVLIQALKYAPKKSDFARAILSDSTIKSTIAKDMTEVPNDDYIEGELLDPKSPAPAAEPPAPSPAAPASPVQDEAPKLQDAAGMDGELNLQDVK